MHSRIVQHLKRRRRFFPCLYSASRRMHKNKRMVYSVGIAYLVEIVYIWDFGKQVHRWSISLTSVSQRSIQNHVHNQAVAMYRRSGPLFKVSRPDWFARSHASRKKAVNTAPINMEPQTIPFRIKRSSQPFIPKSPLQLPQENHPIQPFGFPFSPPPPPPPSPLPSRSLMNSGYLLARSACAFRAECLASDSHTKS